MRPVILVLSGLLALVWVGPAWADADVKVLEGSPADQNSWGYAPPQLSVAAGEAVTWTNNGALGHTATAANGAFDTGLIGPGESKTIALAAPGTYEYICTPHPWMKGTLTIAAAGAAPAAQAATPAPASSGAAVPVAKPAAAQPLATPTPFRLTTSPSTVSSSTAPRAGSLPMEFALPLMLGGGSIVLAGAALLRRRTKR